MTAKAIIFVGPSLLRDDLLRIQGIPNIAVRPPIRRGDLPSIREDQVSMVSIIDGDFYQNLAVSPKEILDAMRRGITVVGGASMGALRAAELSIYGMIGVGTIFTWYRTRRVTRDDDVAILYAPYAARYMTLTVPMVNVIWVLDQGKTLGWLSPNSHRRLLLAARHIHWTKRQWPSVLARARVSDQERTAVRDFVSDPEHDLKRLDALEVVRYTGNMLQDCIRTQTPQIAANSTH